MANVYNIEVMVEDTKQAIDDATMYYMECGQNYTTACKMAKEDAAQSLEEIYGEDVCKAIFKEIKHQAVMESVSRIHKYM